ncbi:MAG TPA: DUF4333 domain-containing protein [Solirubrobacteraceae bacterium]|jgi:hypothetical protein
MTRRLSALAAISLGLVLSACSVGEKTVKREEVEKQARAGLTRAVGKQSPPVKCPKDLKAEKGATTRCHTDFPDGTRLGITVKITSVKGDTARFDIEADQKLTKTPKS